MYGLRSRGINSSILDRELEELTKLGDSSPSNKPDCVELGDDRGVDAGIICDEGCGEFEKVRSANRGDTGLHWTGMDSSGLMPGSSGI